MSLRGMRARLDRLERRRVARPSPHRPGECPPWFDRKEWESRGRVSAAMLAMVQGGPLPVGLTDDERQQAKGYVEALYWVYEHGGGRQAWGEEAGAGERR